MTSKKSDEDQSSEKKISDFSRAASEWTELLEGASSKLKLKVSSEKLIDELRSIFNKESETKSQVAKRLATIEWVMDQLISNKFEEKKAQDIVSFLLPELNNKIPIEMVGHFAQKIIDSLSGEHDGTIFIFLPKMFSAIKQMKELYAGGIDHTGASYSNQIINTLCNDEWPKPMVCNMIRYLRDMDLSEQQLGNLFTKMISSLEQVDIEQIPAIVYQLLLFSTKGVQKQMLLGITECLTKIDKKYDNQESGDLDIDDNNEKDQKIETLRHIEGTVILHINLAIKRDQKLGSDYLNLLKSETSSSSSSSSIIMSSFQVAVLLLLGQDNSLNNLSELVLNFLKSSIVKSLQTSDDRDTAWLAGTFRANRQSDFATLRSTFIKVIENSRYGWETIVTSAMSLGSLLMDANETIKLGVSANEKIIDLGSEILYKIFSYHDMVRFSILDLVSDRIVTRSPNATFYVHLLSKIVRDSSQLAIEMIDKIKESIEFLPSLRPQLAYDVIQAVLPIFKLNASFKDHVILVLRKSIFNRELDSRIIAVNGFLSILESLKSSQNELGAEILGFLRRCFNQQYQIRESLYNGLASVFVANASMREAIVDFILPQFERCFVRSEDDPPIDIKKCIDGKPTGDTSSIDSIRPVEPFHVLIKSMVEMSITVIDESEGAASQGKVLTQSAGSRKPFYDKLHKSLLALITRMKGSELEEFELDKTSKFALETPEGYYNQHASIVLLGTYEVFIMIVMNTSHLQPSSSSLSPSPSSPPLFD
eukprot:TRINITY_DN5210_c0_g1_i1.p1 TRINITY_DN5210_c0_g1~~TRINITY_DN5210_c0_g1_i1.p1  ORF type:complete len:763 (-),score=160.71 TRINITY_DN5210_c0_g1_i1:1845-4133(-)